MTTRICSGAPLAVVIRTEFSSTMVIPLFSSLPVAGLHRATIISVVPSYD
ncbi:hypothetical protein [Chryseobacterium sp.]|nr:hypothetical protein [Chryseobacterium sp.]